MPKTGRRFEREGGAIECYAGAEAAARMDEIAHVEAHSWKATGGHLCFQHGPGPDLFRQAFTTLGDRMELWLARMNGEAVAFQIAFPMGKKIALYNCAYRQEYRVNPEDTLARTAAFEAFSSVHPDLPSSACIA